MNTKKSIHVSVAVIRCHNQKTQQPEFLVAWRDSSKHQGGCYEFVGGKVDAGETPAEALYRECKEELDITVTNALPIKTIAHDYGDKQVCLHVFLVTHFTGIAKGAEGQPIHWVNAASLMQLNMPAANKPIQRIAVLNQVYFISKSVDDFAHLDDWLTHYTQLLPVSAQFYVRDKTIAPQTYLYLLKQLAKLRPDLAVFALYTHKPMLDSIKNKPTTPQQTGLENIGSHVALCCGFHLSHHCLLATPVLDRTNPNTIYVAACHDNTSVEAANQLGVDAVTLSPVQPTKSHPNTVPMGWKAFQRLANLANMPVYALGGMQLADITQAQKNGGFGLAGISLLGANKRDNKLL